MDKYSVSKRIFVVVFIDLEKVHGYLPKELFRRGLNGIQIAFEEIMQDLYDKM